MTSELKLGDLLCGTCIRRGMRFGCFACQILREQQGLTEARIWERSWRLALYVGLPVPSERKTLADQWKALKRAKQ